MATLADLKTRIVAELMRDDLDSGGDLESHMVSTIGRACEYYADRRFWFNAIVTTVDTVGGTATVAIPATVRRVDRVTIPAHNVELTEAILGEVDDIDSVTQGRPERYAYHNDSLRLFRVPDAIYTLRIYGVAQIAAPATGTDTSVWTNEAQDLICAHTKAALLRFPFRDPNGVALAIAEEQDALARLLRETGKRLKSNLRGPADAPWSRNRYDSSLA